MTNEEMIRNVRNLAKKHENDKVFTFGTDYHLAFTDIARHIQEQSEENTKLKAEIERMKEEIKARKLASIKHNSDTRDEIEQLKAELEQSKEQWILRASDNTDYVLAYADGMYCLTDASGSVVCEFLKGKVEK